MIKRTIPSYLYVLQMMQYHILTDIKEKQAHTLFQSAIVDEPMHEKVLMLLTHNSTGRKWLQRNLFQMMENKKNVC